MLMVGQGLSFIITLPLLERVHLALLTCRAPPEGTKRRGPHMSAEPSYIAFKTSLP